MRQYIAQSDRDSAKRTEIGLAVQLHAAADTRTTDTYLVGVGVDGKIRSLALVEGLFKVALALFS